MELLLEDYYGDKDLVHHLKVYLINRKHIQIDSSYYSTRKYLTLMGLKWALLLGNLTFTDSVKFNLRLRICGYSSAHQNFYEFSTFKELLFNGEQE
jgi:hypothetical protein